MALVSLCMVWLSVITAAASVSTQPQTTTHGGVLQGVTTHLAHGRTVDVYRGIPYAAPPVGSLRFQKPQAASPWSGVRDASTDSAKCIQTFSPAADESEDCLYLDVYSPCDPARDSSSLPVMVFIHGGGFMVGSKNDYNGTVLASYGVVVVVLNYRLGPLGFLSTEDATMPGNYGMLDQIAALQWVQDNIAAFGGSTSAVTLFGESAGSASVSLHLLSPLSAGLFSRAIMMSGAASMIWAVTPPKVVQTPKSVAAAAGAGVGCTQTAGDFLKCMQGQDAHEIHKSSVRAVKNSVAWFKFIPRVETDFGFLPDYPLNLLERGQFTKVDTIRGFNSQEMGNLGTGYDNGATTANFHSFAEQILNYFPFLDKLAYTAFLENLYLANVTNPIDIRSKIIEMRSDFLFIAPTVQETKLSKKKNQASKHYLYQFDRRPSYVKTADWMGVLHAVNVQFIFGFPQRLDKNYGPKADATDSQVSEMMMTLWTNFAKFGDPTPAGHRRAPLMFWKQFYNTRLNVLRIGERLERLEYNATQNNQVLKLYGDTETEYVAATAANLPVVG